MSKKVSYKPLKSQHIKTLKKSVLLSFLCFLGLLFQDLKAQDSPDAIMAAQAQNLIDTFHAPVKFISWIKPGLFSDEEESLYLIFREAKYVKVSKNVYQREIITRWHYHSSINPEYPDFEILYCDTLSRDQLKNMPAYYCTDLLPDRSGGFHTFFFPFLILSVSILGIASMFYVRSFN